MSKNIIKISGDFENKELIDQMSSFLSDLRESGNIKKSCKNLDIHEHIIELWIAKGKLFEEPYLTFFRRYNEIIDPYLKSPHIHHGEHEKLEDIKKKKDSKIDKQKDIKTTIKFHQEKCDGLTRKHVSKSRKIDDKYVNNKEIENLLFLSKESINKENPEDALRYLDEILEKHDYYKAFNEKGFILIGLNEFNKAIDCFNKSIDLTKNNYEAHLGKAISYNELLKIEEYNNVEYELEIITNLNIACKINPDVDYIKYNIFAELKIRDTELINNDVVDLDDDFIYLDEDLYKKDKDKYFELLCEKGKMCFLNKKYDKAFRCLHQYLKYDKNNIDALMYLALTTPFLNKYDYSLRCFDKILEINSEFFDAFIFKGELLTHLHRYEEAINCFNKCPYEFMPEEYKKLLQHAEDELFSSNKTKYFGVTKINHQKYNYVYTVVSNGFRRIYADDLEELRVKLENCHMKLKEIRYSADCSTYDYIRLYYSFPLLSTEYKNLISSILNNDFLEKLDKGKINREKLLSNKNDVEKRIIKSLINSMDKQLSLAHRVNYTGYFGVVKSRVPYFNWSYVDLVKARYMGWDVIHAETLDELEERVNDLNSLWYIFDK